MEIKIINNEKDSLEFEMVGMDVAIPQLLVAKLNVDKNVEFAGFKKEHPVIGGPQVLVKTKKKNAMSLVLEKLEEIETEVETFKKEFKRPTDRSQP